MRFDLGLICHGLGLGLGLALCGLVNITVNKCSSAIVCSSASQNTAFIHSLVLVTALALFML